MKTLRESLLDDMEDVIARGDDTIKDNIKQFLKDNYKGVSNCKVSRLPNENGKYVVDYEKDLEVKNKQITSLTNQYFVFGDVKGNFDCSHCTSLTSIEGAPKNVGRNFYCSYCNLLTSLKGAPEKVGGNFNCYNCSSLTSLEGAPEKVGRYFYCYNCSSLKSLKGASKKLDGKIISDLN